MLEARLWVFDLDGTLLPTMGAFADIASDVIARRRGWSPDRARRAYIATSGVPFAEQLEVIFPGHPDNTAAATEYEQRKLRVFFESRIERRVLAALRRMRQTGYLLAVSSNNFESLVQGLIRREAPRLFDRVFGYSDGFAKGPGHLGALVRELGIPRAEVVMVGDSLTDMAQAKACGVGFVGVEGTFAREEFTSRDRNAVVVASVAEVPRLIGLGLGRGRRDPSRLRDLG